MWVSFIMRYSDLVKRWGTGIEISVISGSMPFQISQGQGPCNIGSVGNIISCCISKWWNLILVIHVPRCYCTLGFVAGQHSHMSSPYLGSFWYLFRIYCSDERAVMHVGIANPQWRKKRSLHSRCMRNPQFYVSGRRPMTGIQRVI